MEKITPVPRTVLLLLFLSLAHDNILPCSSHAQNHDSVFSLSCRDASLRDVLGNLAAQKSINLAGLDVIPSSLTVTTNLTAVALEAGLVALLAPNGFTVEKRGEIYFIEQSLPENQRFSLTISEGTLTVDANLIDVNHVARALARAGINITSDSNLTGQVTAHLRNQPLDKALPVLFADFTLHFSDGIYRVESPAPIQQAGLTLLISDGRISVTAHEASLTLLLTELAERSKINLSIVGDIERQNITLRLDNRTVTEILTDLAIMTGYTYRQTDDLHFFGRPEIKADELNPLIERKTIWLRHLEANTVLNLLPIHIPKQNVVVSETHNTVTIVGSRRLIQEAAQFLVELDTTDDTIRGQQGSGAIAIKSDSGTGRLSVDLLNAPRFDAARQLSIETGIDIVFLNGVTPEPSTSSSTTSQPDVSQPSDRASTETVTLRQTDATLESVLSALFLGSGYAYKWVETSPDEKPMLIIGSDMDAPFVESELIALNYLDVSKAMELLPTPLKVNISPLPERSALLVTGSIANITAFQEYVQTIDVPQPQAMIQLYLLELTKGNRDELGLTVDAAENRAAVQINDRSVVRFDSLVSVPPAFSAKLSALVEQNRGKVLANPSLAVVNGEKASIDIGGKHLFETNNPIYPTIGGGVGEPSTSPTVTTVGGYAPSIYRSLFTIETGILLELTPAIGASGEVTMQIQLAIRDASQLSREASSLDQRLIKTTISVPDQGVVVIGGLLQEKEIQKVSRVPILGRIPLLGGLLFSSKETTVEQTELIVIIQPSVIKSSTSDQ